jgi:hypothetical protein
MPLNWIVANEENEEILVVSSLDQALEILQEIESDKGFVRLSLTVEDGSHATFEIPQEILTEDAPSLKLEDKIIRLLLENDPIFQMMWKSEMYFH